MIYGNQLPWIFTLGVSARFIVGGIQQILGMETLFAPWGEKWNDEDWNYMCGWTFLEVRNHVFLQQITRWFQWFCIFLPWNMGKIKLFWQISFKGWLNNHHHLMPFLGGKTNLAPVVLEASSRNRNTTTNLKRNHHHWETSKQMFFKEDLPVEMSRSLS